MLKLIFVRIFLVLILIVNFLCHFALECLNMLNKDGVVKIKFSKKFSSLIYRYVYLFNSISISIRYFFNYKNEKECQIIVLEPEFKLSKSIKHRKTPLLAQKF